MKRAMYRLTYSVDNNIEELVVEVELKQVDGLMIPRQNIYYGVARVNGNIYSKKDLSNIVNPKLTAEQIGNELKDELKKKLRADGKSFRSIKEIIK